MEMALVVVIVPSGGIPVREVSGTSAYGLPVVIAANGRGRARDDRFERRNPVVGSGNTPQ
jgi:hypothetical protein